jgi:hypothetical protein
MSFPYIQALKPIQITRIKSAHCSPTTRQRRSCAWHPAKDNLLYPTDHCDSPTGVVIPSVDFSTSVVAISSTSLLPFESVDSVPASCKDREEVLTPSCLSASASFVLTSLNSPCRALMYSIACSTVLALLLDALTPPPVLPVLSFLTLPLPSGPAADPSFLPSFGLALSLARMDGLRISCGNRAAISCRAVLIRFRRPCSAILWLVRLLVKFSDKASGYETPGRCVPSRMFW